MIELLHHDMDFPGGEYCLLTSLAMEAKKSGPERKTARGLLWGIGLILSSYHTREAELVRPTRVMSNSPQLFILSTQLENEDRARMNDKSLRYIRMCLEKDRETFRSLRRNLSMFWLVNTALRSEVSG